MTDPVSTVVAAPRLALGDGAAAYEAAVERARTEEWATRLFDPRRRRLWTDRPACRRDHLGAPRLARCAGALHGADRRGSRASVTASSTRATRPRSWPAWAAAASPRTSCTGRSARPRATSTCGSSTRPTRPTSHATLDDLDPLRTLVIIASKSGTTTEPNAFLAYAWARAEAALDGGPAPSLRAPGAYFAVITDPGKSPTRSRTTTTSARSSSTRPTSAAATRALTYVGLVPASLIGVDLDALLASARAMLGRLPRARSGPQPGPVARHRDGDPGQGRPRQADVPRSTTRSRASGRGPSSSSPRARASAASASCPSISSRSARSRRTAPTGRSSGSPWRRAIDGGRDTLADALEAAGHPVIRIELVGPDRPRRARASAGRSRPRSPGSCSASTRSTSPTSRKPSSSPATCSRRSTARERATDQTGPIASGDGLALYGDAALRLTAGDDGVVAELRRHLARRRSDAYLCLQGFIAPTPSATRPSPASARCSATGPAGRRPPATARASSTRPASCTRAARRSAGSSS